MLTSEVDETMAELCLGTVQFGMEYGINNQIGRQPTWEESFEMLDVALNAGIDTIDTARAYGEAELVLGEYLKGCSRRIDDLKIVSKLRPNVVEIGCADVSGVIRRELEDSLTRLGLSKLDGYLLHTPEYVYDDRIVAALQSLLNEGLVNHIGVSVYGVDEGFAAIETGVMDCIQIPYSILDQRAERSGLLKAAKEAGFIVATRSAFLQGLFMMDEGRIPEHLKEAVPHIEVMREMADEYDIDLVSAILGFVVSSDYVDYLVFGVESSLQLEEDLEKYESLDIPKGFVDDLKERTGEIDESVIFPSLWSNGRKAE